ncbi:carboxymuconolactone decarboxylase family protein [Brevibacterium sp. JSBI002]|uniref:carboxymuconolactone decarboxylase family protein n=1 Tax=Brevibacterium sp. JSBI002 TaxID=2886045 RepID=UPI0022307D2D|nr:carboxymuconolactone decarboxylase family protein [Brevibacterium sp. JSBI002]UZD61878.1 carboxymuconolactone decarboxylase family protein [Brevibacterium sp. JSBI002]
MTDFFDRETDGKYDRAYKETTPDILKAFGEFNNAVFASEGREIPLKYRELIACAVGLTTQCAYCIDAHSNAAVKAGATETELAETAWTASALRAGGAYAHGRLGFKLTGVHEH